MRTDGAVEPELCFLDCIIDLVMYQKYREDQDTNQKGNTIYVRRWCG